MDLFKENIDLLKQQNVDLQRRMLEANKASKQDTESSKLCVALRSDNENMAKELFRIEKLNKQLREKVLKVKNKMS